MAYTASEYAAEVALKAGCKSEAEYLKRLEEAKDLCMKDFGIGAEEKSAAMTILENIEKAPVVFIKEWD
ncbi:hypothetical protein C4K68_07860 [Pokkaliibacter plantistimulans]|uniref:Uncharacterized protein n=1 Tax=Proteobacteria bacterium 228 TaxID=2083153 RepID=A0A2S5KTI5_9PROT|nr:hypothetical protein [Pokkaliibacter plantistimulans]PPC77952.1 hypothetical protein C4K68_07860 [Pokkaliibacter plantistimulans]